MRVVIDTNIFLVMFARRHRYHLIKERVLTGKIDMVVTNEILSEYAEKFSERLGLDGNSLVDAVLKLPGTALIDPSFRFQLISADPDDNKFVDCAIIGTADYIISDDRHFLVLTDVPFPRVAVLTGDQFLQLL